MVKDKNTSKILSLTEIKKIKFKVSKVWESPGIVGVYYKKLDTRLDGRGDLTELWSKPWANKEPVTEKVEHVYYNTTHEGVVKGWHVHEHTFSQYTCVFGKMQIVLVDLRKSSKTFGFVDQFVIGEKNPSLIKIPPGVLKAWKSLRGDSVIINLLTSADLEDNYKYPIDSILNDIWEPKNS